MPTTTNEYLHHQNALPLLLKDPCIHYEMPNSRCTDEISQGPLSGTSGNTAPTWVLVKGDNTPLHWASMRGHVEIVKYLLQHNADRGIRNKQDKIPIDLCQPCWSDAYRYTRQVSML